LNGTIAERFRRVAGWQPQHPAIVANDAVLTYGALDAASERVMQAIRQRHLPPTGSIAVLLPQGAHVVAAILGCLKAGYSFVVLSPDFPTPRLRAIWTDAGSPLLLSDGPHWPQAVAVASAPEHCLNLDQIAAGESAPLPPGVRDADDLAALFYTSGTTGEPKGVMWSQRLVLHTARQNQALYALGPHDRLAVLTSFGFGAAMTMSFAALLSGATLLLGEERWLDLDALVAWLRTHAPTVLGLPPVGLLSQIVDRLRASRPANATPLPNLRLVLLGGQPLQRQEAERFRAFFGQAVDIRYRLAGSETMLMAEFSLNSQQDYAGDSVPVGNPAPDTELLLLDEERRPVRAGAAGEIAVRSRYLATGYWRQPQLTAATFLPDVSGGDAHICLTGDIGRLTPNGLLLHLGRKDNMVKIRGYRVQLEAVEAALSALEYVREAVVVAQNLPSGDKRLVAYVVPVAQPPPTATALRRALQQRLPDFMAPAVFVFLERPLPLTATGKVDRQALPPPGTARPDLGVPFVAPRSVLEQQLADIWAELLGLDAVGVHDNFFELGGDSITAMRLVCQLERHFQQPVALRQFIFKPTIVHLATLFGPRREDADGEAPQMDEDAAPLDATASAELRRLYDTLEDQAEIDRLRDRERARVRPTPRRPRTLRLLLRLPQPVALRLFYGALQQSWVQQRFLPRQTALVQRFLAGFEPPPRQEHLMARCLFFGALTRYGLRAEIFPRLQAAGKIPFAGLDALAEARSRRQGVILLVSHTYQARYFHTFGLTQGGIGSVSLLTGSASFDKVDAEHVLYSRQLELARQKLQQGQVIYIAPDVTRGHGAQMTLPFHGHMHPFRTSFAELALLTDAQLFFVASDLQQYDRFSFELAGPFDMGTKAMAYEARVQHLMLQYVAHLRQQWARNPWALPWWLMTEHLAYPPAA
jgi:amino acid adenylation domain-containing protein